MPVFPYRIVLWGGLLLPGGLLTAPAWAQMQMPPLLSSLLNPPAALPEKEEETVFLPLTFSGQTAPPPPPNHPNTSVATQRARRGKTVVKKFSELTWSLEGGYFRSPSSVQVVYTDPTDPTPVTLTAQSVDYDGKSGLLKGRGGFRLVRADATFTGKEIDYNFVKRSGEVLEGIVEAPYFRMNGSRLLARADGAYVVENGLFTTCEHTRPDYQIRARQLTVLPNQYVSARGVALYLGGTKLISVPSLRRNLRTTSAVSFPRINYNRAEGPTIRLNDNSIRKSNETLDYDFRLSFRGLPIGFLAYQRDLSRTAPDALPPVSILPTLDNPLRGFLEQLAPPTFQDYSLGRFATDALPRKTFFATVQNNQFVFNRNSFNLTISRFPEVGVNFANILARSPRTQRDPNDSNAAPTTIDPNNTSIVLQKIRNAPFLLDAAVTLGAIREMPTRLSTGRLGLRLSAASQPFLLGPRMSLRFGLSQWINAYGTGNVYGIFSPEIDLNYVPTSTSLLGIGYRYASDWGRTPFVFDRRDIRHELMLRYQVGGPWAFGVATRLDLERARSYESEIAILRNFDCMQFGIGYRFQAQQFNFIINLLPPAPNRIRERRTPLPAMPGLPGPNETDSLSKASIGQKER
jgi:hypothetical protein